MSGGGFADLRLPATPTESAELFDIMRALVAGLLLSRKGYRVRQTAKARIPAHGLVVRFTLDRAGTIEAWLEPGRPELRHGVPYVPDVPSPDPAA